MTVKNRAGDKMNRVEQRVELEQIRERQDKLGQGWIM